MPTSALHRGRGAGLIGPVVVILLAMAFMPLIAVGAGTTTSRTHSEPCSGNDRIVCENQREGAPSSEWDVEGAGDPSLQGFATSMSVLPGERVEFKVRTDAPNYDVTIYRMGYYNGDGARRVDRVTPSVSLPQVQPPCLRQPGTGLIDCGTWAVSAEWLVPSSAVSGVYVARLRRSDTGGASHIIFVIRDDTSESDIVMQTSDSTWQAYNTFGGNSLYSSDSRRGRAVKVSYNRPLITRGLAGGRDSFFANEYPMVQFLEANGLDVTYMSGMDTAKRPGLLRRHKVFVSTGHDEYWTGSQRAAVEAARDAGVSLAFFGGNSIYWRTRWESSPTDDSGSMRTLVCFKESWSGGKSDPSPQWTGTWRDSSPAARRQPGVRPENALMGTAFKSNSGSFPLRVPAAEGRFRIWRETAVAYQPRGSAVRLGQSIIGYEFDEDLDNGVRPPGLIRLSKTAVDVDQYLVDDGARVAPARAVHRMTLYRAPSGALVFSAGTIQWSWGLGMLHVGDIAADSRSGRSTLARSTPSSEIQQATLNVLADMRAVAQSPQPGLVATVASTDRVSPRVVVTHPRKHADVHGPSIVIRGRATDTGGRVAAVEFSTDRGSTWHPAQGLAVWHARIPLMGGGRRTIRVRAVDDSANIGRTSDVHIRSACPCSALGAREPRVLRVENRADGDSVEVGTTFMVQRPLRLIAIRYYRGPGGGATPTLRVWSPRGRLLWQGEPPSRDAQPGDVQPGDVNPGDVNPGDLRGWHTIALQRPIPLRPRRDYVVSSLTRPGVYAVTEHMFDDGPILRSPITLVAGVFRYGSERRMPTATFAGSLYPIDPVVTR